MDNAENRQMNSEEEIPCISDQLTISAEQLMQLKFRHAPAILPASGAPTTVQDEEKPQFLLMSTE